MTPLRVVSITHPGLGGVVGTKRLNLLPNTEVTVLTPYEASGTPDVAGTVRRISMPTRGRRNRARFPSLGAALSLLDPDVVHLHADPDTSLALQVARLCRQQNGRGLVLETEMDPAGPINGWVAPMRARRTLSRTHAVVARTPGALASLRRLGFDGLGLIAGRGLEPQPLPDRELARRSLTIAPGQAPVIGWSGPLDTRSHIADLLEAVALCSGEIVVVIPAAGSWYQDVLDRADALEILQRVRFVTVENAGTGLVERPDLAAFPAMLAAVDAVLVAPPRNALDRAFSLRTIELAHTLAIPVIHPGLADMADLVGAGGWQAPLDDPALMARLFDALQASPVLLQTASAAASANALARHSPEAAAVELARAVSAAAEARRADGVRPGARAGLGLTLRQPEIT